MDELIRLTARELVDGLAVGRFTSLMLLDALEARVAAVDPVVNALPTTCFERARVQAERYAATSGPAGPLHGLPVPIKDLSDVAGVRSTRGSPIYADHVPAVSSHVVERLEGSGGLVYAKSNTPEFGAGASTFNPVFGRTANPWDLTRSPAGSSGGAAAALASGQAWLAQGSDMGGSLRNPASFCGVVGLRPSPGRVPHGPTADLFGTLSVDGPMARNCGDLGLMLDAMAGPDPREPVRLEAQPPGVFRRAGETPARPLRVAFTPDLGGLTPVEPEVARICEDAARALEAEGVEVIAASPDFSGAHRAFQVLRAIAFAAAHAQHYADHRDALKADVIWNIEEGHRLTGADVAEAALIRTRITAALARFLGEYDLLLSPATCVAPFPVDARTVMSCAGVAFETYIDWLAMAYAITLTSAPALSLPCGFTRDGLPVGLQMVAPFGAEADLLAKAAFLERMLAVPLAPIEPR